MEEMVSIHFSAALWRKNEPTPFSGSAVPLAGSWHKLARLSGRFHRGKVVDLADSADTLPSVAAAFRGFPESPRGYHANNLAGRQPSPFCCTFPLVSECGRGWTAGLLGAGGGDLRSAAGDRSGDRAPTANLTFLIVITWRARCCAAAGGLSGAIRQMRRPPFSRFAPVPCLRPDPIWRIFPDTAAVLLAVTHSASWWVSLCHCKSGTGLRPDTHEPILDQQHRRRTDLHCRRIRPGLSR
jgi:hypothetical protein